MKCRKQLFTYTTVLCKLVLLNVLLHDVVHDEEERQAFPPQRSIMLLKQLLDLFNSEKSDFRSSIFRYLRVEVSQLLLSVIPIVKGSYGDHWNRVIEFLCTSFQAFDTRESQEMSLHNSSEIISLEFYSLKLYGLLKTVHEDNDDLLDAFIDQASFFKNEFLSVLKSSSEVENKSQPRIMAATLLSRHLLDVRLSSEDNAADLYSILSSDCKPLQKVVFKIQSRQIAEVREELLIEVALDTQNTLNFGLPFELLSLIMEPPATYDPTDFQTKQANGDTLKKLGTDYQMRSYLYAWMLILEHFTGTPSKVRAKYIENLKEGDYVESLLQMVFVVLNMHHGGKLVDVSQFEIDRFDVDEDDSEDPGRNLQWLIVHVYYLALNHLPSICRSWWFEIRNRQLSIAVESFTQKFVSPLLISKELTTVRESLKNPEASGLGDAEENENIEIKVSKVTGDVTALFSVDEYVMEMVIHVPEAFPLKDVYVEGPRRIGVKENQWRAWLLASQAVINSQVILSNCAVNSRKTNVTFLFEQNGTILDALILFKRNFNLHFEGVTECAICCEYSCHLIVLQ